MSQPSTIRSSSEIAEKLRQALQRYNRVLGRESLTQKKLAERIGVQESTLSRWLQAERTPNSKYLSKLSEILEAPELLDLTEKPIHDFRVTSLEKFGVHWLQFIPPHFTSEQAQEMETGFDVFERFFVKQQSTDEVRAYYRQRDVIFLYNTFKSALRANCLQIVHVPRATDLEKKLKNTFKGIEVFVADVPEKCDCSPIRTEFVAWLFAMYALPTLSNLRYVGVGYGYTMLRIPEIAIPNHQSFNGVNWIPLSATHYEYSPYLAETATAAKIPSANYIVRRLQNKFPSSVGWYRRYHRDEDAMKNAGKKEGDRKDDEKQRDDYTIYQNQIRNLQAVVTSVNGEGRKSFADDTPPQATQWRTGDYIPLANLREIHSILVEKLQAASYKVGGEMLGVFFDTRGKQILFVDSEETEVLTPAADENLKVFLGENIHSAFFQIDLRKIWEIRKAGLVWIVASRDYKAAPIYYALKGKLANALVIDREIAEILLEMHEQDL